MSAHADAPAISPDGATLVVAHGRRVELRDPERPVDEAQDALDLGSIDATVSVVAVSPSGRSLAVGTSPGVVLVFDRR